MRIAKISGKFYNALSCGEFQSFRGYHLKAGVEITRAHGAFLILDSSI